MRATRLGILVVVLACAPAADAPATERVSRVIVTEGAAPARPDSLDASVPLPELLRSACLRGDPAEALPWAVDSVALPVLPMQPIETLAARDSAQFAARIARLVDVLPSDTSTADFRGLPVVVRAAWRVVPTQADTVVVALVARRVPIESAPLEEVFLVVAAPGQRAGVRDPLVSLWSVREVGTEEEVSVRELASAHGREGTLSLLLVREMADGPRVELVTRRAERWVLEWEGRVTECPAR